MTEKIFLLISLIFFSITSFSQKVLVNVFMERKITRPLSDTIYYDAAKQLTWKDFQGVPDNNRFGGAITSSGFAFNANMEFDRRAIYLNIGVYTYFSKHESWKKSNINSAYHLLHEQHHFDITRLGSEDLVKQIAKAKFTKDNYNSLLNTIFDKVYKDNMALQQQYDNETRHSINTAKQLEWNNKIEALKKSLSQ